MTILVCLVGAGAILGVVRTGAGVVATKIFFVILDRTYVALLLCAGAAHQLQYLRFYGQWVDSAPPPIPECTQKLNMNRVKLLSPSCIIDEQKHKEKREVLFAQNDAREQVCQTSLTQYGAILKNIFLDNGRFSAKILTLRKIAVLCPFWGQTINTIP